MYILRHESLILFKAPSCLQSIARTICLQQLEAEFLHLLGASFYLRFQWRRNRGKNANLSSNCEWKQSLVKWWEISHSHWSFLSWDTGESCLDFLLISWYGRSSSGLVFSTSCALSLWLVPQQLAAGVPLGRISCKVAQIQLLSEVFTISALTV